MTKNFTQVAPNNCTQMFIKPYNELWQKKLFSTELRTLLQFSRRVTKCQLPSLNNSTRHRERTIN